MADSAWVMDQRRGSVRCLLLPLMDSKLLLPSVSVAEVLSSASVKPVRAEPAWVLGMIEWRFVSIPLISFEVVTGKSRPDPGDRYRVAVLHTLSSDGDDNFYGVLMQGIPNLVQIRESELTLLPSKSADDGIMARVEVLGHLAVIPDLELLEKRAVCYR